MTLKQEHTSAWPQRPLGDAGPPPVTQCQTATERETTSPTHGRLRDPARDCRGAAEGGAKRRPSIDLGVDGRTREPRLPSGQCGTLCIASLQIDGNTEFLLRRSLRDRDLWVPQFERVVRALRRPRSREQEQRERAVGITVVLPIDGTDAVGNARVSGTRREVIGIHFPDRAYVRLNLERNETRIQAKTPSLWADGLRSWMATWLGSVGWLLTGRRCIPDGAWTTGWRTSRLELASDFIGFPLRREDGGRFVGKAGASVYERLSPEGPLVVRGGFGHRVEAIAIGERESPCSLYIYSKTAELRAREVRPSQSVYAPVWAEAGAAIEDEEIVRVELRFTKRGLRHELLDAAGRPTGFLDLSRPEALLNRPNLAALWASETARIRLVKLPSPTTRPRRAPTDSRWVAVQRAAGITPCRTRQVRAVRQLTHAQRKRRAARGVVKGSMAYAALHGVRDTNPETLKRAASLAIDDASELDPHFDRDAYAARLKANLGFVSDQCDQARLDFNRRLRGIGRGEWDALTPTEKLRLVARLWARSPRSGGAEGRS